MAYYFECETCKKKELFVFTVEDNPIKDKVFFNKGKKQKYETVICSSCILKKDRLKSDYIII